jgi:SAM-dependent methyltransferase
MQPESCFGDIAAAYRIFRPTYPPELFEYLASAAPARDAAWDCATGSGQAAVALAAYFRRVVATDASEKQIRAAHAEPSVEYLVAPAERSPLADASIDLVTVAQALHWFDRPAFYAEVRRVLRPGGVLACWCYALMTITPRVDALVQHLYGPILGEFWPPERRLIEQRYATIEFPFDELKPPAFAMTQCWTLTQTLGYLDTWSAVAEYKKRHDTNPLDQIAPQLTEAWGDAESAREVVWPLYVRAGRVGGAD